MLLHCIEESMFTFCYEETEGYLHNRRSS